MSKRRVAITGLGMVTPLGLDSESTWGGLLAGRSGVAAVSSFDPEGYTTKIAAEVKEFDPTAFVPPNKARKLDRFSQLGIAAALPAWRDSGLDMAQLDPNRVGVIAASGIGGIQSIEEQHEVLRTRGPRRVTPFLIPRLMINAVSGEISMLIGAKGPNWVTSSACASSGHGLGTAMRIIQYGDADIVISGGTEAAISPLGMAGFCSLRAMSTRNDDPERASRPFDKDRDGFIMGEGAAFLILEEMEHAKARGASIYCEFAGFGGTADAYHITQPAENAEGAQRAMRLALADGGATPADVDYVNAHGTSTPVNDPNESAAIRAVLGDRADSVPVSSTKSMIGHLLGASAAAEAVVCALSISRGVIHQTANHETPGEGCDLDYVKEGPREMPVRGALSNSLGFGGHNSSLYFRSCD